MYMKQALEKLVAEEVKEAIVTFDGDRQGIPWLSGTARDRATAKEEKAA